MYIQILTHKRSNYINKKKIVINRGVVDEDILYSVLLHIHQ